MTIVSFSFPKPFQSMSWRRQNAFEDEDGAALSDAFQRVQEALHRREQNARQVLRRVEESATAALQVALGQLEQKLQQRDEAVRALEHRMEARILRLEGRMAAAEQRLASLPAQEEAKGSGEVRSLEELRLRMKNLEASVQRALASVFPRVEALLEKLEKPSTGATCTPSSSPASPSLCTSFTSPSSTAAVQASTPKRTKAGPGEPGQDLNGQSVGCPETEADEEEEQEKREVMARVQKSKTERIKARMSPSLLGEKLCQAAYSGRLEDVRRLTNTETYINYIDKEGDTPLISAVLSTSPNASIVSILIERGANVNAINDQGITAIHYAASDGKNGKFVRLLISGGADVNARDETGATPLHWAAFVGNESAVRALLAVGAKSSLRAWSEGWTNKTPFDVATSDSIRKLLRP